MSYASIGEALARHGLVVRGDFAPEITDGVPLMSDRQPAKALVLVGDAGGEMWTTFSASPEFTDGAVDPLDRWSKRVIGSVADALGARALYPFGGPPHLPFQRWAMRAEPVHRSPLGLLIHPAFGLWHSYRGALALGPDVAELTSRSHARSPCATCADRPCLTACPVGAFSGAGYDVALCAAHLRSAEGARCREGGCRARRACPVGRDHTYADARQRFHMQAFVAARSA